MNINYFFNRYKKKILGFELVLWSEIIDQKNMIAIIFPRVFVLADKIWNL
jgi:N-acetyl-beta-hexosaminidase